MYLRADSSQDLILYNVYIAALLLWLLMKIQFSLLISNSSSVHSLFSDRNILTLLSVNVLFIQLCILSDQVRTHWLLYINAILIQSQGVLISVDCINCQTHSMTLFWNVIVHQNILMNVAVTVSDMTTLLTVLYAWCSHCHLRWWEQQQCQWEWVCCSVRRITSVLSAEMIVIYVVS
jgi:hypothetical protein